MTKRQKIAVAVVTAAGLGTLGLFWAAARYAHRLEPYIRTQVTVYLSKRFESEVEIGKLDIRFPRMPSLRLFLTKGRDVIAQVEGTGIVLRHHGRRDIPPMFQIKRLAFEVDVGRMFDPEKRVAMVTISGLHVVIPPKGERPSLPSSLADEPTEPAAKGKPPARRETYFIERVVIEDSSLSILPRAAGRRPLDFALHRVALSSVQLREAMSYEAEITNPKPIGLVRAEGSFGPWRAHSPADTPLDGTYSFTNADLGIFKAIAGILQSTGEFSGTLDEIEAHGVATVPDFRLKRGGRPKRLETHFDVLVDGTNGNTTLKPIRARLGSTAFTTTGAVLKHDGDQRRTIDLDAHVPAGELRDFLELAMRGDVPISGKIALNARIKIPPLSGKVAEKLILDGRFTVEKGQFLKSTLQDKVDELSRRAQGEPKNTAIDDVFSHFTGRFHLENQHLSLPDLAFAIPGAQVNLGGGFDLDEDQLDLAGTLKLDARVSQTMTGWKRWVLKPADPFFAKNGAGTFLKIRITGNSKQPDFSASR